MARHNLVFLLGTIVKEPMIQKDKDTGEPKLAIAYLNVIRGYRDIGDRRIFAKYDTPCIMTKEPELIREIDSWKKNDVIEVKGVVATARILKSSVCSHCGTKNRKEGTLVYVNPFFAKKRQHLADEEACMHFLSENREVSNQIFVFGTLVRDPKKLLTKSGLVVTQYQIALNRKYRIRTDPPEIKSDYPWVKAYGDNAISDHERLMVGSEIFVDGCLQERGVQRKSTCASCGEEYEWRDRALEIVPYATEYVGRFRSDEEVEEEKRKRIEQVKNDVLKKKKIMDGTAESEITEDDIAAGIDTEAQ